MTQTLTVACTCGQCAVTVAVPGRKAGTRVVCYCKDCQTAAHHFGAADTHLVPGGGSQIYQTTPNLLSLERGAEHLAIMRLGPKGLMRWHARCCNTPLFNTLENLGLSFVGVLFARDALPQVDKVLGPARSWVYTQAAQPGQGAPAKDRGMASTGYALFARMIKGAILGDAKASPLRDETGGPIAPIQVLTKEARAAAHPG